MIYNYYICKTNNKQIEIMNEKDLKNGQDFHFENEELECGSITWNDRFKNFAIEFNGKCIHTSKTFKTAEKRLEKLMSEFNCEFTEESEW